MPHFTWKDTGLTAEALMRRMADQGFELERHSDGQRITHPDSDVFEAYGFINEESPVRQLTLLP